MSETTCRRFEREGLRQLEAGRPLDPHFETCPDCRRARAEYEGLGSELAALGTDLEPPGDWQARTWARIERREAARRGRWKVWLGWLAPIATAAALVVFVVLRLAAPTLTGLEVTVERGSTTSRGVEAKPGDRLTLRAPVGGAAHAELRLYRDDHELVLRCSTEAPCERRGDVLRAVLVLPAVGSYQPLFLAADVPPPAPTGDGLDADADRALAAGARVELGAEVWVE